jgi:hypothetical protein
MVIVEKLMGIVMELITACGGFSSRHPAHFRAGRSYCGITLVAWG